MDPDENPRRAFAHTLNVYFAENAITGVAEGNNAYVAGDLKTAADKSHLPRPREDQDARAVLVIGKSSGEKAMRRGLSRRLRPHPEAKAQGAARPHHRRCRPSSIRDFEIWHLREWASNLERMKRTIPVWYSDQEKAANPKTPTCHTTVNHRPSS